MKTEREIELEKQVATLRAALEELVTPNRGMGFGGMDRRFAEENARAVLADPNLGTDWVSGDAFHACDVERGALQVKLAETQERHQAELQRVAKAEKLAQAEVKRLEEIQAERARLFFEANAERAEVSLVLTGRIEAPQPGKLPTIARAVLDAHRVELRRVAEASWSAGHQSGCKCDHMVEPDGRGDCASERVRDLDAIVRQDCGTIWR